MDNILMLRALADENRWKILSLLSENQYCVRALSKILNITESAVSQHLKLLREANIVIGEKRG